MRPSSSKGNDQIHIKLKGRDSVKVNSSSVETGTFADHKKSFGVRQVSGNIGLMESYTTTQSRRDIIGVN